VFRLRLRVKRPSASYSALYIQTGPPLHCGGRCFRPCRTLQIHVGPTLRGQTSLQRSPHAIRFAPTTLAG